MHSYIRKKEKWKEKYAGWGFLLLGFLAVFLFLLGNAKILPVMRQEIRTSWCNGLVGFYVPYVSYQASGGETQEAASYVMEKIFPLFSQTAKIEDYQTDIESALSYEMILAMEAADENYIDPVTGGLVGDADASETEYALETGTGLPEAAEDLALADGSGETQNAGEVQNSTGNGATDIQTDGSAVVLNRQKAVTYPLDKLADFDYLIQNFYRVDNTTTINGSQLNASEMLAKSMELTHDSSTPQILIYHTHSQEGYADSVPGDLTTTVVGVGEYLAQLLTEQYGLNVIHHTGVYDTVRDQAYSEAGPALEQILAENPGIEVVIDLHRDGVGENTRLVTNLNGTDMAQIMFVNGLSRTTTVGDIDYLYNPNLAENLAFSFQVELAAAEYYPGFSRGVYLKGYRYNMHYCPKTLLVEVGAQTNTLEEAKNAMVPLADILYKVVTGSE